MVDRSIVRNQVKSMIASSCGKCSCSINMNTNLGNYNLFGPKYDKFNDKLLATFPKLNENIRNNYTNGESVVNHIMEVYSK